MFSRYFYILVMLFVVIVSIIIINQSNQFDYFNNIQTKNNYIPKIIHQTAPRDRSKWKEEWFKCHDTWVNTFESPEYVHILWFDEDLDNLIKDHFPWFKSIYDSYDSIIKKVDIARYFILYKYGGIYADMDYLCTKNFYDLLPQDKISISESPWKNNEYIQNALMISPPENDFWLKVIEKAKTRTKLPVLDATGPRLLSDTYFENTKDVNILPEKLFNPNTENNDHKSEEVYTIHLGTKSWI